MSLQSSRPLSRPSVRRTLALAAASAVAIVPAFAIGGSASGTAAAGSAASARDRSTPVPIAAPDGVLMSYVLNTRSPNANQVTKVKQAVKKAGGTVIKAWPQIGVVIAHSDVSDFRSDVRQIAGGALASVGATRTAPVSEGTPGSPGAARRGSDAKQTKPRMSDKTKRITPDPREGEQWDLKMIKADKAHKITQGSRKVVVGVLDSGIDADHPDLAANIDVRDSVNCTNAGLPDTSATGWQPTTSDHGTHVAGTIGAARNGVGIVGVAPKVRMASVKVVNDDGFIYPEYAVCGFMWAGLKGMDVTNNSYYVDPFEFWCGDQPDQGAAMEAVRRAVSWSTKRGVVHAAAAGNSSYDLANKTTDSASPNDTEPIDRQINKGCKDIPTELPGVVTVSSLERFPADTLESRLSSFSNRGKGVIDVAAPGSRILSTVVADNGYGLKSGTSMASPHAAGVLALMKSAHPGWKPAKMIRKLREGADDKACSETTAGAACTGSPRNNSFFGEGKLDALAAVR